MKADGKESLLSPAGGGWSYILLVTPGIFACISGQGLACDCCETMA